MTTIGQREKLEIAHRFTFLKNAALDGFSEGIDYDRLTAGTDWVLRGLNGREPTEALICLFAAPWQAAKDEGEFDGDCRAEALKDIARISADAAALSSPPAGEAVLVSRAALDNLVRVRKAQANGNETAGNLHAAVRALIESVAPHPNTAGEVKTGGRELMAALDGFDADYMTSETHHPGYVLIPTAKFEAIQAALALSPTSGGEAGNEFSAVDMLKRIKRRLMHHRRFGPDTLNNHRRMCTGVEGDVEEWLIDHGYQVSEDRPASPEREGLRYTGRRHDLKTWPEPFAAVRAGLKPWELRKNDRDFQIGDLLWLQEWEPAAGEYTGEATGRLVTWMLHGPAFGLPEGYVIMSLDSFSALPAAPGAST